MPRRNENARQIRYGVAKRGRHRNDVTAYVRRCTRCDFVEVSDTQRLLALPFTCPNCDIA